MKCNYFPREITPKLPKFSNDNSISESDILNVKNLKKVCLIGLMKRNYFKLKIMMKGWNMNLKL